MVALWMTGLGDAPGHSGEICVCEVFGRDLRASSASVGVGIDAWGDPALSEDWERVELPIDATAMHDYAVEWTPGRSVFSVDGEVVKVVAQAPAYPLQPYLAVYEFSREPGAPPDDRPYPKRVSVESVRGYRYLG